MTLYFYLAKRFMFSVFRVQLAIFILMLLLVATEQTRILSERGVDATTTLKMIALQMPSGLTLTFPLVMLLGSLFTFLGLSRSSELVVVRAAGTSALRVLLAPVVLTLVIGAIGLAAINPIVAATIRKYDEINSSLSKNDFNRLSISGDGLWLRQETENSQFVIQARSSSRNGNTLVDVRFHEFSVDGILLRRIEAAWANLELGEWVLGDATQWRFFSQEDSENRDISHFEEVRIPTSLTSDGILESFAQPESISIWRLPSFITQLEASGFSAIQHQLFLQTQFALPFLLVAMVLIGAGFSMRHVRFGNTGIMALIAVLSGFLLFALKSVAESLGEAQQIPISFAAWFPSAAAILLALTLILHLEDG